TVHAAPSTPEGSMRIESVIFDCEGTLVDSELLANTVLVEYAASFGLRMSVEEAMRRYVGGKMADCVAGIENQLGHKLPETFIPELRARTACQPARTILRGLKRTTRKDRTQPQYHRAGSFLHKRKNIQCPRDRLLE